MKTETCAKARPKLVDDPDVVVRPKPKELPETVFEEIKELSGLDEIPAADCAALAKEFDAVASDVLYDEDDTLAVITPFVEKGTGNPLFLFMQLQPSCPECVNGRNVVPFKWGFTIVDSVTLEKEVR